MIAGWDDAPVAKIRTAFEPKSFTLTVPYYENADFLAKQIENWIAWPSPLRPFVSIIIVDDGSPQKPARDVLCNAALPFPIALYRIGVDVRWNWLAARNIAMHHAPEGWCLGTDMDHVVTSGLAEALVWGQHDPSVIYRFSRREHTGEIIHPHPNSFFMTKEIFWKFGGYDERLSGLYGSDGDARRRWVKTAPVLTLPDSLVRYEKIGDSSTRSYGRKEPKDAAVAEVIAARTKDWKPLVLSFPYREISL